MMTLPGVRTGSQALQDLLPADHVRVGVPVVGRRGAILAAADLLAAAAGLLADAVAAVLLEREELGTTAFGAGTAVPHGRMAGAGAIHVVVLRLAAPVDWAAVDGLPVDLVVAILGPEDGGAENLKALARVSRALRDRGLVKKLRGARDAAALWALLGGRVAA
jgi:PTS system nitrogen regulatory IIA component